MNMHESPLSRLGPWVWDPVKSQEVFSAPAPRVIDIHFICENVNTNSEQNFSSTTMTGHFQAMFTI